MDYEKLYKEALSRAEALYDNESSSADTLIACEEIFPELTESEDERIRGAIIDHLKDNNLTEWASWLEKQVPVDEEKMLIGARRDVASSIITYLDRNTLEMCLSNMECEDIENAIVNSDWNKVYRYMKKKLEKKGEQKPFAPKSAMEAANEVQSDNANKIEHLIPQKGIYYTCIKDYYSSDNTLLCVKGNVYESFFNGYIDDESHFGLSWTNSCAEKYFEPTKDEDWIVCEHDNVIGKPMQYKEFKKIANQKFIKDLKAKGITPKLRLWNISDAKEGDVLAAHECYVIFKEIDGLNIKCHCTYHYMNIPSFHVDTLQNKNAFHPVTKEQCDILFAKMREAGYEWDAEKKELKKIEPKSDVWTKKDKRILEGIIDEIEADKDEAPSYDLPIYDKYLNWLKSLKKKIINE